MDQNLLTPWSFFIQGIALGLAAAATPGAYQAYLITQSIIHGYQKGGVIAFAPLISDPPVVITVLLSLRQIPQSFLRMISLGGGVFLIYLAYSMFKRWRRSSMYYEEKTQRSRGKLIRGAILNILSLGLYF